MLSVDRRLLASEPGHVEEHRVSNGKRAQM